MLWIYIIKPSDVWLEFQTVADNKEEAALKIAKEVRISGYNVDMQDILAAVHLAPEEKDIN